jgi:hypothetical protein
MPHNVPESATGAGKLMLFSRVEQVDAAETSKLP